MASNDDEDFDELAAHSVQVVGLSRHVLQEMSSESEECKLLCLSSCFAFHPSTVCHRALAGRDRFFLNEALVAAPPHLLLRWPPWGAAIGKARHAATGCLGASHYRCLWVFSDSLEKRADRDEHGRVVGIVVGRRV